MNDVFDELTFIMNAGMNGWKLEVNESEWRWINVNESKWKWMKVGSLQE